jgi:hypothetical protein
MPPPRTGTSPQPVSRRQAAILWSALAGGLAVFTVLGTAIAPARPTPELAPILLPVIALMSVAELVAGHFILRSVRRRLSSGPAEAVALLAQTQLIVACSLALGIGLFGVAAHFTTRDPLFLVFPAGAAVALAWWFPSEARWARLSRRAAAGGRTPMIRG